MGIIKGFRRMITNAYLKRQYRYAKVDVATAYDLAKDKMLWYKELIEDIDGYKEGKMKKSKLQEILTEYGAHFGKDFSDHIAVLEASAKSPHFFESLESVLKFCLL